MYLWRIACYAFLIVPAIVLTLAASAQAQERIRLVGGDDYAPFAFTNANGQPSGILVDIWRLWDQKSEDEVEVELLPFAQALEAVREGRADAVIGIYANPQRRRIFDFSEPLLTLEGHLFLHDSIFGARGLEDLEGFRVGVVEGDHALDVVRRSFPEAAIAAYESYEALVRAGLREDISVLVGDAVVIDFYLARADGLEAFHRGGEPLYSQQVRAAVRKGDAATLSVINQGLAAIDPAEIEAIIGEWRGVEHSEGAQSRLVYASVILMGLLAGVFLIRYLQLKSKARRVQAARDEEERMRLQSDSELQALMSAMTNLVAEVDFEGRVIRLVPTRYSFRMAQVQEIEGALIDDFLDPSSARMLRAAMAQVRAGESKAELEIEANFRNQRRWFQVTFSPLSEQSLLLVARDVTNRRRAQREVLSREKFYGALIANSSDLVTMLDREGRIIFESPSLSDNLGFFPEEMASKRFEDQIHPEDRMAFHEMFEAVLQDPEEQPRFEVRRINHGGQWIHFELRLSNLLDEADISGIVINGRNVTERKLFEEELKRHAFYDSLTGLPNRSLLADRIDRALARTRREDHDFAVLYIDLDRFKIINESLGHQSGDVLLRKISRRLADCLGHEDTAARFSGDEFVVLVDGTENEREALRLAGTISDSLSRPILIGEREVVVSVSIGVAYGAAHYESAEQIIRDADTAMHRARAQGLGRQMVFDATMHEKALDQLTMEQELRKALEREELVLHYQPIVRLEDGLPAGVEALLRWQHPDRGMVSPLNFIPLAEETGLILPIGDWVLEAALRQLVETGRRYPAMGQSFMSVNLSVKQLGDTRIVERIARIIGEAGARPENVKLEVTESMVMANPKEAGRVLEELKRLGVRLAMDDFGIGYSSLSNLSQFPFDMIKIDRSFVRPLSDPGCRERDIVGAIIAMADSLSLTVVAEGIETREQWEFLARRGCKFGQGYHFAKPLDAVSLDQYISLSIDHMPVADVERFRRAFEEA